MLEIFTGIDLYKKASRTALPETTVPAMAYIPFQEWGDTYDALKAFDKGTIFPILDKPFYGKVCEPR